MQEKELQATLAEIAYWAERVERSISQDQVVHPRRGHRRVAVVHDEPAWIQLRTHLIRLKRSGKHDQVMSRRTR